MTMRLNPGRTLLLLAMMALQGASVAAAGDRAERERIDRERRAAEQAFKTREEDCRSRFVVTACMEEAQRDRRETIDRLRMQQDLLDEAARRERAAQRLEEIRQKVEGEDAKQREAAAREQRKQLPLTPGDAASASRRAPSTRLPHEPALRTNDAADAAQRAEAYRQRQQELEARRAALERRNAERSAKDKPARALPLPLPAASAPGG